MAVGYDLERMLNPRTVAVIGDAKVRNYRWIRSLSTFTGKVYSVQIDPKEIPGIEELGIPNYTSLLDVPDEIDYALVAVPRVAAAVVLRDCIAKGVGGVGMFTSGFAETDTEEGRAQQQRITDMAREARLPLIGPNCMGLYHPGLGVRFMENQPAGFEGDVTFLSQSGGHAVDFSMAAHASGVPVRMAISFGNGVILENADYLEYFGADEATRYIAMYVEGLRDGPRFFAALREAARRKPVVLWKGGLTDAGGRATSSHTASLAGAAEVWDAVFRQTGAIPVTSVLEMVDVLKGLRLWPRFSGNGVGLTGGSGGQSVAMADVFSRAGMRVPALSEVSKERLASWFSLVGASFNNPVDMGSNRSEMDTILDVLAEDPGIDSLVMQVRPGSGDAADQERLDGQLAALARLRERSGKPVAALVSSSTPLEDGAAVADLDARLREIGVAAYPTYERAAVAMRKVLDYYQFRDAIGE
ncbi:MAG: CoA-binding protein [Dehalococcoidia bacterium]